MRSPIALAVALGVPHFTEWFPKVDIPMALPEVRRIEPPPPAVRMMHVPPSFKPLPFFMFGSGPYDVVEVDGLIDLFGGEENLRIAVWADRIEVARLRWRLDAGQIIYTEEPGHPLAAAEEAFVRGVLTSDGAYDWDEDYDCISFYDVRFKFWRRSEVVFVDVYMMCPTVRVIKDGREIAYKRCDYGAEALAEAVAVHFPDLRDELANQVPEPTRVAVTISADAELAPAPRVAHR